MVCSLTFCTRAGVEVVVGSLAGGEETGFDEWIDEGEPAGDVFMEAGEATGGEATEGGGRAGGGGLLE